MVIDIGRRPSVITAILLTLMTAHALEAQTIKSCVAGDSGDACIFDVTAIGDGTLTVDTKASKAGDRWRATIVRALKSAVITGVGNGSATQFSGVRSMKVVTGRVYEVIVN
jgi:hypothetical protein